MHVYKCNKCLSLGDAPSYIFVHISIIGHGFKLAPVVGKLLSELALDLPPSYDLKPFKMDRFSK